MPGATEVPDNFDYSLKVILVGSSRKRTRILWGYAEDAWSDGPLTRITEGSKDKTEEFDGINVIFHMWGLLFLPLIQCCSFYWLSSCVPSTETPERVSRANRKYYDSVQIVFVTLDVTSLDSFQDCRQWLDEVDSYAPRSAVRVGLGLFTEETDRRAVTKEVAQEFFSIYNIPYFEASPQTGEGVRDAFVDAARIWIGKKLGVNNNEKSACFIQ